MTDDQYKEGLIHLIETVNELDSCETWGEVEHVTDYLHHVLEEALASLDNKRVLN